MFYEPGKTEHGLPHDPFKACVVPRPIGWISTTSLKGVHNLAPFSQFNILTFDPPCIMFSANQATTSRPKDTVDNVERTGKFCWNLATWDLRHAVNVTSEEVPPDVDEFERAGLEKAWSRVLSEERGGRVPMVERSPIRFECEYYTTLRLPGAPPMGGADVVFGRVVGVHLDESVLTDGKVDVRKTQPIARCGYFEYTVIRETFDMVMPGTNNLLRSAMVGSAKLHREFSQLAEAGMHVGKDTAAAITNATAAVVSSGEDVDADAIRGIDA